MKKNSDYYQLRIDSLYADGEPDEIMYAEDSDNLCVIMHAFCLEVCDNSNQIKTYDNGVKATYGVSIQVLHIGELVDIDTNEVLDQEVLEVHAECKIYKTYQES